MNRRLTKEEVLSELQNWRIGDDAKCSFDPTPYLGHPIGMFHCPECGQMVLAGFPHPEYKDDKTTHVAESVKSDIVDGGGIT